MVHPSFGFALYASMKSNFTVNVSACPFKSQAYLA